MHVSTRAIIIRKLLHAFYNWEDVVARGFKYIEVMARGFILRGVGESLFSNGKACMQP